MQSYSASKISQFVKQFARFVWWRELHVAGNLTWIEDFNVASGWWGSVTKL